MVDPIAITIEKYKYSGLLPPCLSEPFSSGERQSKGQQNGLYG